jgi:hypothetical protein
MRIMARSFTLALLALALALVCGCATAPLVTPDTTAPTVSALAISPKTMGAQGGAVALSVHASDNDVVSGVVFTVTHGATSQPIVATLQSGVYRASFPAPTNLTATTVTYGVTVQAHDSVGNTSQTLSSSFTVSGVVDPPDPPQ